MSNRSTTILFFIVLAAAGLFVLRTGSAMPDTVASHFGPTGSANGYMSRRFYVHILLVFAVLLPLGINWLVARVLRLPDARINIPHREYWLAPERRAQSVARLQRHMQFFGTMLAAFLCYVHWQVVQANAHSSPMLDNAHFAAGLAVFMVALVAWTVVLRRQFRPPPS